ncbi:ABC transporter permease [Saxibacter everestensis]|uniref:Transport permease protein n=1 Tax=Saxibacter everestensis TaxID=2909229 RepID=A0ABY8QTZ1_9MICO|nr:ABC transporter permease [Brevibacteriaceae bacterium ZFBP1038]
MSLADYAAQHQLRRVGARPTFPAYIRQVWARRAFIYSLARFRIQGDNERNRLGMAWVVLKPLLSAVVYGVVFGLLQAGNRPENFVQYLVVGVMMFEFFNHSMGQGSKSITKNTALVQSLAFPRMVLPLATAAQQALSFGPMVLVMLLINIVMGSPIQFDWLLLIPAFALYICFNTGVTLIAARLTVHFRDLDQLLPFISRIFFYTSGVFFDPQKILVDYPTALKVYDFQPLHEFMTIVRGLLVPGYDVPPMFWIYAACWSLILLAFGSIFFWEAEERYGRDD